MKNCLQCNTLFEQTGKNHKYCMACAKDRAKRAVKAWGFKTGLLNGSGSGSRTGIGRKNHMYSHGRCVFRRWAKERLKQLEYCCERCGQTIDVSARGSWAGHHKDHNRYNNIPENLEVLCKRCHQVEHECWRAFQSVTTMAKASTQETVEARSIDANR